MQGIGLSLYENLGQKDGPPDTPGHKVTRTQWLDLSSLEMTDLVGKNILIVDEVDDTRTTLEYAVRELEKDVKDVSERLGRAGEKTNFFIFVLHVSFIVCRSANPLIICYRTRTNPRMATYLRI